MAHETANFRRKNYGVLISSYFSSCTSFTTYKLHNNTIDLMYKIQKNFIWQGKKAKIKYITLCNEYENGGLKNVDLRDKITSMQCSWVNRFFEDDFRDWKAIPLF